MRTNRWGYRAVAAGSLGLWIALLGLVGCSNNDDAPKHKSIKGRVTRIDVNSGEVFMLYYNPTDKKEKEIPGTLAPDAEILINGRTAKLEEVMVDDQVEVTGRIEKHAGEKKLVALKVYVKRPVSSEPESEPAAAASRPAK